MKKTFLKKIAAGLIAGVMAFSLAASVVTVTNPIYASAQENELTGKNALDITAMMGKGFNIGNTLDATGGSMNDIRAHETSWGNPQINKELMHGLKEAGFNTVRIPITWEKHVDKNNNYAITDDFKARVKEVVDLAYEEDLFVIINVHHESWVNRSDLDTAYLEIGEELKAIWEQVADLFADYDQHLIFEGMNEPRAQGTSIEWTGNSACYDAIEYLDKLFVETVRANGKGYNNERVLMIPGYAASSNPSVLRSIVIPEINGEPATNVAVSVHCYSPYNFCLSDAQTTFDPKNTNDTADITTLMSNLKTLFLDKDIAVVIGECGCTNSGNNNDARLKWFTYFGDITAQYGIPAVVWDNGAGGTSGGECHKYMNRSTGESLCQDLIDAFVGNVELGDTLINFETEDGSSSVCIPSELGFTSTSLNCKFRVNHTEDVKMGFALKVESSEDDFTALLDITRYAGIPVKVSAWIRSDAEDQVSVGIKDSAVTEMAVVSTSDEWTQVSFVVTPAEGKSYIYFKGNNETFYVDDILISMDTSDASVEGAGGEVSEGSDTGTGTTDGTAATVTGEENAKKVSPIVIVLIVCGVIAVGAVAVIAISSKKNKK